VPMTNQEFFTKVVLHSRTMTERSLNDTTTFCRYRGSRGGKCFVGGVIPDNVYEPDMEGDSVAGLVTNWPEVAELFEGVDGSLMTDVQGVHDNTSKGIWPIALERLARTYLVEMPA
jgi:hypothetical protein